MKFFGILCRTNFLSFRLTVQAELIERSCWFPKPSVVFNVLLSARITAAFLSNISDCDETYNYWEPVSINDMLLQ